MFRCLILFFLLNGTLLPGIGFAETKLWVIAASAYLEEQPRLLSTQLRRMPMGTPLILLSPAGNWVCVITPEGERGWVHRKNVSKNPPETILLKTTKNLLPELTESRITASPVSVERSIRGRVQEKSVPPVPREKNPQDQAEAVSIEEQTFDCPPAVYEK